MVWSAERIQREVDYLCLPTDIYDAKWAEGRREETNATWVNLRHTLHELGAALYEFTDECNVGDVWAPLNTYRRAVVS